MGKDIISRFAKGVFSTGAGSIFQLILGLLGFMVAIRIIPKEEFGIFVLIEVIYTFFGLFSSLVLENITITKFITSVDNGDKENVANTAACYKIIISFVIVIIILLCKPLINLVFKNVLLLHFIIYVPLFFFLSGLYELFLKVLQGFHQYRKMAISRIINGACTLLLIIIFLVPLKMYLLGFILANLIAFIPSILYQYMAVPIKKRLSLNPRLLKRMFRFGFPLGLNSFLYFVYTRIDRFLLFAMISPVGVAYYEVAARIPTRIQRLYLSFIDVYFPNISECFAKKEYEEAEKILNNSIRLVSFATIFFAVIAYTFQKEIVRLLFSNKYIEAAPALTIIMVGLSAAITGTIMGTSLVAVGQSDKPVKVNLVNVVTNIVCNLVMIPKFGFIGAAYAALISNFATIPIYVWYLKMRRVRIEISHYLKTFLAYCFVVAIFSLIRPASILTQLSSIIVFLILCGFLAIIKKTDVVNLIEGLRPSLQVSK